MSGLLNNVQSVFGKLETIFTNVLNRMIPSEKRAEMLAKFQDFAINNPKLAVGSSGLDLPCAEIFHESIQVTFGLFYLSVATQENADENIQAFLTTQIVLTGLPLVLFITFSITVFVFSLIVALLIGVLAAVLFTLFMVGVALLVVLPIIFMTTFTATFLFLGGLGGYYILKWFNEGDTPAPDGASIGDKINSLTGECMSWLKDGFAKKQDDTHTGVDKTPKTHDNESEDANGKSSGRAPRKLAEKPRDSMNQQSDGVQKRVMKNPGVENVAIKVSEKTDDAKENVSVAAGT